MYDTLKEKQVDDDILAMENDSKTSLARLEKHIRDYYVSKGYIINPKKEDDWGFKIVIETYNKHKTIEVTLADKMRKEIVFDASASKLSELFGSAFDFFSIEPKIICNICGADVGERIDRVTLICHRCSEKVEIDKPECKECLELSRGHSKGFKIMCSSCDTRQRKKMIPIKDI